MAGRNFQRSVEEIEEFYSVPKKQPYDQTGIIADILFLLDEIHKIKKKISEKREMYCINCGIVLTGRNYKYCHRKLCQEAKHRNTDNRYNEMRRIRNERRKQ